MNGTFTATIDRIVDQRTAVILIEDDGDVVEQLDVPVERLPESAQKEGGVVTIELTDGEIDAIRYEPEQTRRRREAAQNRLDRLSNRLKDRE